MQPASNQKYTLENAMDMEDVLDFEPSEEEGGSPANQQQSRGLKLSRIPLVTSMTVAQHHPPRDQPRDLPGSPAAATPAARTGTTA